MKISFLYPFFISIFNVIFLFSFPFYNLFLMYYIHLLNIWIVLIGYILLFDKYKYKFYIYIIVAYELKYII
jgi:hypothetical protein